MQTKANATERREYRIQDLEVRSDGERTSPPRLVGHAAVFDQEARINGWGGDIFIELVAPGAFSESIGADDVRALWNHDGASLLGRTSAGTLDLAEDEVGLAFDLDTPDTQLGRDLAVLVERGDVSEMSFGFRVQDESWEKVETEDGKTIHRRTLKRVQLVDVSPVTWPAYTGTDVETEGRALPERSVELRQSLDEPSEPPAHVITHQHLRDRTRLAVARSRAGR